MQSRNTQRSVTKVNCEMAAGKVCPPQHLHPHQYQCRRLFCYPIKRAWLRQDPTWRSVLKEFFERRTCPPMRRDSSAVVQVDGNVDGSKDFDDAAGSERKGHVWHLLASGRCRALSLALARSTRLRWPTSRQVLGAFERVLMVRV